MTGADCYIDKRSSTVLRSEDTANFQPTPFVIDISCHHKWTLEDGDGTTSSIHLRPTDVPAECMPNPIHWDQTFDFMPGVCPQGWLMHSIATTGVPRKDDPRIYGVKTTAYCCPSGYTLADSAILGMSSGSACSSNFPTDGPIAQITVVGPPDDANRGPTTRTFYHGDVVQPAWHLLWKSGQQRLLVPTPPHVSLGETIEIWTPPYVTPASTSSRSSWIGGQCDSSFTSKPPGCYATPPNYENDRSDNLNIGMDLGVLIFLIAGLPAIIGVLLVSCCTRCCVKYRRDKKAHKQWQMDAANREAGGEVPWVPIQPGVRGIPPHLGGDQMRVGD